jgi:hypothetical protein
MIRHRADDAAVAGQARVIVDLGVRWWIGRRQTPLA